MTVLENLRREIDAIDAQIVALIGDRFICTEKIGQHKRQHQLPASDPTRESLQMTRIAELSALHGVRPELAQRIFRLIIDDVVERHQRLIVPPHKAD